MLESFISILPAFVQGYIPEGFKLMRPDWLWALLVLPPMIWWLLRRRRRSAGWSKVCDAHLLPHLLAGVETKAAIWPLFILVPAWFTVIIALAGPVWQKLPQPVFDSEEARVIVLDLSRSMDATDVAPSRLTRAKYKLQDLLKRSDVGQTGLVVFAGDAFVVSPLTQDANTIAAMVPALETSIMPVQGGRVDIALLKADALFKQGDAPMGEIILITDGINERALSVAEEIVRQGRKVSVMSVGTPDGAPIPVRVGGFLKDRNGGIVIPRLDVAMMSELAAAGGGVYTPMRDDDSDVELLTKAGELSNDWNEDQQNREITTESWREEGPWLLLGVLPFALLAFRRGGLVCIVAVGLFVAQPNDAMAAWDDWWFSADQQGASLLKQGKAAEAAAAFEDPAWKAQANYVAGNYEQAATEFEKIDTPDGHYNRGNALAQQGKLDEALMAYDAALAQAGLQDGEHPDAKFNREIIAKLLEQQQESQSSENGEGDSSEQPSQDPSQGEQSSDQQQGESQSDQQSQENADSQGQSSPQQNDADQQKQDDAESQQGESKEGDESPDDEAKQAAEASKEEQEAEQQMSMGETDEQGPASESEQAVEQWLKRIPDDPGGLLRRKFIYQYQREQAEGRGQQAGDQAW